MANGWNQIAVSTITGIANTSTTVTQPFFTGLNFTLPANTTYGFVVYCTGQRYYTLPANATITANGVDFIATSTTAYGNGIPPAAPSIASRGWIGDIIFQPAVPCTAPPTPGTSTAAASSTCVGGTVALNLTGASGGTGQTYQWQSGPTSTGPWTNIGAVLNTPAYTATVPAASWFRCALTCTALTTYSTPVQVTTNANLPAGTYTINPSLPASSSNYQSYSAAAAALACGIAGPVIFNVAVGSGPYNEQVTIPSILNGSAVNTVTFNCNNTTINYTNTSASSYAILKLDGSKYVRFNKLTVVANSAGTAGYAIQLLNGAKNNIIDSCTLDAGINIASSLFAGLVIGGTANAISGTTISCDSNTLSNSTVMGGYYCTVSYGVSTASNQYNQFINNVIRDYYVYGSYMVYNTNMQVVNNEYHRMNRTTLSTFYGCYMSTGNLKMNVSKNRIHNPYGAATTNTGAAYGVYHGSTATVGNENIVSNNIFYNMDGNGAHYVMYTAGAYVKWYYNTVSEDFTAATAGLTYACYIISTYAGVEYKNNNISLTRGGATAKYCIYESGTAYPAIFNKNNYFVSGAANSVGYYGGTICATLPLWQAANTNETGSLSVDPTFVGATTGNLTPTNLVMDNLGLPITGITTDILGTTRNTSTPDAGAFEFNNCNPPTGLAASAITNSNATLTWNTVPGAAGYEYVVDQNAGNPAGAGAPTTATTYGATGLSANTTYYLHVRTSCGTASFSSWVTLLFTSCVMSVVTPASTTTFCNGGSVVLNAPVPPVGTNYTYQWSLNGSPITPGGTGASYTASATGNYALFLTNTTANCTSASTPPTVVTVGVPPSSAIIPAGTAGLCPGSNVTLTTNTALGLTYQWYMNGNPISQATSSSFSATQPGSYTVSVSSGPGCLSITATPTVVSILTPPPASITPPANTFICQNSTLPITANSGTAYAYQWYLNGTPITVNGTGITYNAALGGNYTVTVTNTATGCSTASAPLALTTAPLPPASILPSAPATGCDSIVMIANSGPGYTYKWKLNNVLIPNATTNPFSATTSGIYSAVVTDVNGCSGTSANVAITINPSPASMITYATPLTFCDGGTVALNSFVTNGVTYTWLKNGLPETGDTTAQKLVTMSGTYNLMLTNTYGCTRISPPVTVVVNALPTPVITRNLNVLSTGSYISYQWDLNSHPIPGANGQSYTFTKNGAYTVHVADQNGCEATSPLVFVNNLGVSNVTGGSDVKIYPNPVHDLLNIEASVKINVVITDLSGKVVMSKDNASQIDVSAIADGAYMILVADNEGHTLKIEKLFKTK